MSTDLLTAEQAIGRLTIQLQQAQEEKELSDSTIRECAELLYDDIIEDDVAIDALVLDAIKRMSEERDRLRHALVTRGSLDHLAQCPSCLAERTNGERHEESCPLMLLVDSIRRS